MSNEFHSGALARIASCEGGGFGVVLAVPPAEPLLSAVVAPGAVSAVIEHDAGATWPDRDGRRLVREVLRHSGVAVLAFTSMRDAMACLIRLRREGVR